MTEILLGVVGVWLLFGIWFVATSRSRGWKADALFVATWPIHLVRHWAGKD